MCPQQTHALDIIIFINDSLKTFSKRVFEVILYKQHKSQSSQLKNKTKQTKNK